MKSLGWWIGLSDIEKKIKLNYPHHASINKYEACHTCILFIKDTRMVYLYKRY